MHNKIRNTNSQEVLSKNAYTSYVLLILGVMIIAVLPLSLLMVYFNKNNSIGTYLESHFEYQKKILWKYAACFSIAMGFIVFSVQTWSYFFAINVIETCIFLMTTGQSFFLLLYVLPKVFHGWKTLKAQKPITNEEDRSFCKDFIKDEIKIFQDKWTTLKARYNQNKNANNKKMEQHKTKHDDS